MAGKKPNWIQGAVKGMEAKGTKGALHKELGVPAGKTIPTKKLDKALKSSNPLEKKRAVFAANVKKGK